jgi:electron transfer flavoprotein alpha subunit
MAAKIDRSKCIGCGACNSVCPNSALSLKDGKAICDNANCISCGSCVTICPCQAIKIEK